MADSSRRLNSSRFLAIGGLLLACVGLEYCLHVVYGITSGYPHLFYTPIVVAALWWGLRGGLLVSLLLGFMHAVSYSPGIDEVILIRCLAFVAVGSATGTISDRHKRAGKVLRESEEQYRNLVERANDGITTVQDTLLKYANQRLAEMVGYTVEEMINTPFTGYISPDELPKVVDHYERRMAGEDVTPVYETALRHRDGRRIEVEFNAGITTYQGKPADFVFIRDITARKQAEEQLRTRERFLECLSKVSQQLLRASNIAEALPAALRRLGETADVSRVYLFENHPGPEGELLCSRRYEWCAPEFEPQTDSPELQNFPYIARGFARWMETLARGQVIAGAVADFPAEERAVLAAQDIRSTLVLPLFAFGNWYGFIGFAVCDRVREWQQVEIDLLRAAANDIASAIEREQARRQAQAIAKAAAAVTATLDIEQVLDHILEQVSRVVPSDAANVMLIEGDQAYIVRWRGYERFGTEEFVSTVVFHVPEVSNLQQMVETGEPILIPDTATYPGWVHVPVQEWLRSYAAAPIVARGEVIGFLNVDSAIPGFFTPAHIEPLRIFAGHAAAAIENARLFEQAQHRLESLVNLNQASQIITSSLNVKEVLEQIADLAGSVANSDYTSVVLLDEEGQPVLGTEDFRGVRPVARRTRSDGVHRYVLDSGQPVVVDIISDEGAMSPPLRRPDGELMEVNPDIVAAGIRSFAAVPIQARGKMLGVMFVHSREPCAFRGQLPLLTTFANQAAVAIENARLFEAAQRRVAELEALRQASLSLTSSLELEAVLETILESTLVLLAGAQNAHIFLYQAGRLTFGAALWADGRKGQPLTQPRPHGLTYTVARQGQPVVVPNMRTHPLFADAPPDWEGAIVGLPLKIGRRVVGVMSVAYQQPRAFPETELRVLRLLADQAAIAIENAHLYKEAQHRVRELTLLNSISAGFGAALDVDTTISSALEGLQELVGADRTYFITADPEARTLETTHQMVAPDTEPGIGLSIAFDDVTVELETLLAGQPFAVSDIATDPRIEATRKMYRSLGTQSMLLVPVQVGRQLHGVLGFDYYRQKHVWQPDEIRLLEAVARQLGLALDNVRLFREARLRAEELAAALARQEELDRLKDQFIQNVSHELRSPLALILGYAEMLKAGELGELRPEQQKPAAVIARRARMLGDLVQDITLILEAEVSPPKPKPVPLDELTWAAVEDFQVATEQAELTLQAEIAPHLPPVSGSQGYLRRVLDNLIGNAVKFTPAGGTIAVRLRQEGKQVILEVSDTGVGIPPDQLERIFERFYQVDGSARRRYGGVGLGLALVKEIVEAYGGNVTVESQVGEGTTFTVSLPIAAGANKQETGKVAEKPG